MNWVDIAWGGLIAVGGVIIAVRERAILTGLGFLLIGIGEALGPGATREVLRWTGIVAAFGGTVLQRRRMR